MTVGFQASEACLRLLHTSCRASQSHRVIAPVLHVSRDAANRVLHSQYWRVRSRHPHEIRLCRFDGSAAEPSSKRTARCEKIHVVFDLEVNRWIVDLSRHYESGDSRRRRHQRRYAGTTPIFRPDQLVRAEIHGCKLCGHTMRRFERSDRIRAEARWCHYCNP